ncbi:MAG: hypothetical protein NT159_00425 [Proteobacteria bacterium]|nr:hypothetical protein [Pseudomonadota bacterium]
MRTCIQYLAQGIAFTLLIQVSNCWAAEGQEEKIAALVSNSAQKIGGTKNIGVGKVTMNWASNPEVKEVVGFGNDKRVASLTTIIGYLATNEEKIFPNVKTNSDQLAAAIITRMFSLTHLSGLLSSADNDVVVKDYLDGEIADLKLILSGKINYSMYLQSRRMREDKRSMLLLQDKGIVTEMRILMMKEDSIAQVLANKTTIISLLEVCDAKPDLCAKLQAK